MRRLGWFGTLNALLIGFVKASSPGNQSWPKTLSRREVRKDRLLAGHAMLMIGRCQVVYAGGITHPADKRDNAHFSRFLATSAPSHSERQGTLDLGHRPRQGARRRPGERLSSAGSWPVVLRR